MAQGRARGQPGGLPQASVGHYSNTRGARVAHLAGAAGPRAAQASLLVGAHTPPHTWAAWPAHRPHTPRPLCG